jgi:small GTP-binding protein
VEILDTAGEEDYQNMMDMWISFGEGFLLVFAINDKESFTLLKGKHDRVLKGKHGVKCPILLVGNKQDLENERQVTYAEAKAQASAWGIEYMETSDKTNFNCKEAFEKLAQTNVKSKILNSRGSTCPYNII